MAVMHFLNSTKKKESFSTTRSEGCTQALIPNFLLRFNKLLLFCIMHTDQFSDQFILVSFLEKAFLRKQGLLIYSKISLESFFS